MGSFGVSTLQLFWALENFLGEHSFLDCPFGTRIWNEMLRSVKKAAGTAARIYFTQFCRGLTDPSANVTGTRATVRRIAQPTAITSDMAMFRQSTTSVFHSLSKSSREPVSF
jgi:hypothetical protein